MAPPIGRKRRAREGSTAAHEQEPVIVEPPDTPQLTARPDGPYDSAEPFGDAPRVDFGSMQVPVHDGLSLQLQVDQNVGVVASVDVIDGESVLALSAFAAPRSEGLWADVSRDLQTGISNSGGLVDVVDGVYGPELRGQVATPGAALTRVRFVGVDGPRWLLRGVFTGPAAAGGAKSAVLDKVLGGVVVSRGSNPMAPGDLIAITVPQDLPEALTPGTLEG